MLRCRTIRRATRRIGEGLPVAGKGYKPRQALSVLPYVNFRPAWMIDCGPADGREAWVFKEAYPWLRVLALEPAAGLYPLGDYPGKILPLAAWNRDGEMLLSFACDPRAGSLVREGGERRKVETVRLTSLNRRYGFSDAILWLDVEGAELPVLEGAADLLRAHRVRLINVEVHEGEKEAAVDRYLTEFGFRLVLRYEFSGLHHDNVYRL